MCCFCQKVLLFGFTLKEIARVLWQLIEEHNTPGILPVTIARQNPIFCNICLSPSLKRLETLRSCFALHQIHIGPFCYSCKALQWQSTWELPPPSLPLFKLPRALRWVDRSTSFTVYSHVLFTRGTQVCFLLTAVFVVFFNFFFSISFCVGEKAETRSCVMGAWSYKGCPSG